MRLQLLPALSTALLMGCASRSVPAEIAPTAASSVEAKEAPVMSVTRSLEENPPLPAEGTKTSTAPHHHGGHHDH